MTQEDFEHEIKMREKLTLYGLISLLLKNSRELIIYPDIAAARFAVALNGLSWSFMLILAGDNALHDITYAGLTAFGNGTFWAVLMGALGTVQLFTLIARVRPSWYTAMIAFFSMLLWTYVTISLMLSSVANVAVIATTGVIAWLAIWVFIRSRHGNEPDMRRRATD